ncbi:Jumonji superfamily protein [Mycena kentingensis (nom. inval.)]|nr:Jumonji superfamily protein [Mycena kentingensis (nom. inval.)]
MWYEREQAHNFVSPRKFLPAKQRPSQVAWWVSRARPDTLPPISDPAKFGSDVALWWSSLVPKNSAEARKEGLRVLSTVPGINGMYSVMSCMRWWYRKQGACEEWTATMNDIVEAMKELKRMENGEREENDKVVGDEPASGGNKTNGPSPTCTSLAQSTTAQTTTPPSMFGLTIIATPYHSTLVHPSWTFLQSKHPAYARKTSRARVRGYLVSRTAQPSTPPAEEFKDPMAYTRSISQTANDHGICKVVPPPDCKMPFVTDTANFRFKTRLQRLNSVEASSRAKINFLEQLYVWHQQQGNPRVSLTKKKQWSDFGRLLGYSGIPGLSTQLKNSYTRVILPYKEYEAKNAAKEQNKAAPPSPKKPVSVNGNGVNKRLSTLSLSKEETPESPLTTNSTMSEPPEEPKVEPKARPGRSTRMSGRASPIPAPVFHDVQKEPKEDGEQNCEICHKKNRGDAVVRRL